LTIARIVFTRIFRAKRTWAIALLPALGVLTAVVARNSGRGAEAYGHQVRNLVIPIILALVALVISTSAIGDEREDLTILYLTQTTVPRLRIVVETWFSAFMATLVLMTPAVVAEMALGSSVGVGGGALVDLVLAIVLAAAGYCALGVLLALLTKRAALVGLVYVLLWEGTLSGFAAGARNLSIAQHARSIVARNVDALTRSAIDPPSTGAGAAVIALLVAPVVLLMLGQRRLQRMNLP
jgi:ABC-2 type transport system permease protein